MTTWVLVYLYGWVVATGALMEKASWDDLAASAMVGLLWPICIPVRILRKLITK